MNEYNIAATIRRTIKSNHNSWAEIVIQTFPNLWFRGKKFTDSDFTKKLMQFAKIYEFGYVTILNNHGVGVAIRFWEKEKPILVEEITDAKDTTDPIEQGQAEDKGTSDVDTEQPS